MFSIPRVVYIHDIALKSLRFTKESFVTVASSNQYLPPLFLQLHFLEQRDVYKPELIVERKTRHPRARFLYARIGRRKLALEWKEKKMDACRVCVTNKEG